LNQFDVYVNPIVKGRAAYPFVCALQNKLFNDLSSSIVAFICNDESIALDKISVPIRIAGQNYFVCMNVVTTFESHKLVEFVENISGQREDILAAYDAIFTGI
jgi:hypothetical protein